MDCLELDVRLRREAFELAVSETLDLGGISAVFGANGSGKTSLLRVIAGLEPGASGTIRFRGDWWLGPQGQRKPEARAIGFVFQDGRLFSHLDVASNLRFPLRHGGRTGPVDFASIVRTFELGPLLERHPDALSGGERQRVAIARALLSNPKLLLMDEPLSSLDVSRRRELVPLIRNLPVHFGIPIVYVTHDIDELIYLADRVLLLANGRKIALGSAREILERSDFAELTDLDDAGLVLEATIEEQAEGLTLVAVPGGRVRMPRVAGRPGETVRLRIRPRDVVLALEPVAGISIRNCIAATVGRLEDAGGDQVLVSLKLGQPSLGQPSIGEPALGQQSLKARITRDAARELALAEGLPIHALIKSVALDPMPRAKGSDPGL